MNFISKISENLIFTNGKSEFYIIKHEIILMLVFQKSELIRLNAFFRKHIS